MKLERFTTPKQDVSWYIKWFASIVLLIAMSVRASQFSPLLDIILSLVGVVGWFFVGLLWHDRALILLNGASIVILLTGLLSTL
jgi:hypothetical protein